MQLEVITLTPALWTGFCDPKSGLVGKALNSGLANLRITNLADYGEGPHRQVDDKPYGGGAGMVIMAPPLIKAIKAAKNRTPGPVVLMTPRGIPIRQQHLLNYQNYPGMIIICPRYEGVDERVYDYVDHSVSLGDFIISGGDIAAMALLDGTIRLLKGCLGNTESLIQESFQEGLLEYPQYTRPQVVAGKSVPEILLSGHHAQIEAWREQAAFEVTRQHRADLLCVEALHPTGPAFG